MKSIQAVDYKGNDGRVQVGRVYNMTVNTYTTAGPINLQTNCFSFQFTNIGDVKAWVNDMVINPSATPTTALGDSRAVSAHQLDIYKGNISLRFDPNTAGIAPAVEIVQLFYAEAY